MSVSAFWRDKTALITGGLGFIGSRISAAIAGGGGRTIVADRARAAGGPPDSSSRAAPETTFRIGDIADGAWLGGLVEEFQPHYVFHLAGQSIVDECNTNPIAAFESNIAGTWNLLDACRRNGKVMGVIVASSYKVYGDQDDACFGEDAPLMGLQPYDAAKVCADVLSRSYYASFGLSVAVTRCANTYGEGDRHLSRIIPAVIHAGLRDEELVIRSDGRAERDYLYIGDAVDGYLAIAEGLEAGSDVKGEAFNLGSGKPLSVLEVVDAVGNLLGKKIRFRVLQQPRPGVDRLYLDIRKAKERLSWEPKCTFADGLKKTIKWHRASLL